MTTRRRWLRPAAALLSLSLLTAACGDDDDDASGDGATSTTEGRPPLQGDGLRIGVLFPESGSLSGIVGALRTPVDLALEEINAAGGVLGEEVVLGAADDGSDDTNLATAGFETLVESDGVHVLLGPAGSPLTKALMDRIKDADIVACSGSNTTADLATLDDGGHYFGFAPNDDLQGPALAEVIADDGHESVGILARNDAYGTGFANAVEASLEEAGVEVVLNQPYDPANATGYRSDVQALVDADPDAAVVIGYGDDGAGMIKEMIGLNVGPADLPIYTGDGMKDSKLFQKVDQANPAAIAGIKGTAPAASPAGVDHPFAAAYAETGEQTIFSAYYYDCTMVMALAAHKAGSLDAAAIGAAVFDVAMAGTPCKTFAECKALLDEGEDIDYEGASGSLDLSDRGHVTRGAYDVWQYDETGADTTLDVPQVVVGAEE
jgi:ABC-type branched-subunit amino acid transport system substrate-binding protein